MMQEENFNETSKFQELGTALRKRREQQGLDIEDIALRIKVSVKNLQAIEAGRQAGLPQPVFTRGFIRSYAQVLEMDPGEVETLLKAAFPEVLVNNINADRTTDAREQSVGINSPALPKKFFAGLGLLVLLGAIGAGVWLYLGGLDKLTGPPAGESAPSLREPAGDSTPALEEGEQSAQAGPVARAGSTPDPDARLAESAPLAESGGESGTTARPTVSPPAAGAVGPPAARTGNQESDQAAVSSTVVRTSSNPPAGIHQVQISVLSGRSWIGIQADDAASRNFELRTGSSYRLEFRQKATITIGNAAGVQVTYNGQRVPFTAREGEVKILRFPPAG
ncbi:MAG: DUF4115 domain-containing protein [Deltaproteobacteria bacterium]|jgi:cytoskeleton protein RodZ|nr:DUF4115 domain-containing protein [Deltaproteobacteria bacterium]